MSKIIEMVKNKSVTFVRYQCGELWYVTECGFEFPVPISETGNGAFLAHDRAATLMSWINKHLKLIEQAKEAESGN